MWLTLLHFPIGLHWESLKNPLGFLFFSYMGLMKLSEFHIGKKNEGESKLVIKKTNNKKKKNDWKGSNITKQSDLLNMWPRRIKFYEFTIIYIMSITRLERSS